MKRTTFEDGYARKKTPGRDTVRLMDMMLVVCRPADVGYCNPETPGNFVVLDLQTRQKAWFEIPAGFDVAGIQAMIEGHFDATAHRIFPNSWVV